MSGADPPAEKQAGVVRFVETAGSTEHLALDLGGRCAGQNRGLSKSPAAFGRFAAHQVAGTGAPSPHFPGRCYLEPLHEGLSDFLPGHKISFIS